jgi:hypothetical protein
VAAAVAAAVVEVAAVVVAVEEAQPDRSEAAVAARDRQDLQEAMEFPMRPAARHHHTR